MIDRHFAARINASSIPAHYPSSPPLQIVDNPGIETLLLWPALDICPDLPILSYRIPCHSRSPSLFPHPPWYHCAVSELCSSYISTIHSFASIAHSYLIRFAPRSRPSLHTIERLRIHLEAASASDHKHRLPIDIRMRTRVRSSCHNARHTTHEGHQGGIEFAE